MRKLVLIFVMMGLFQMGFAQNKKNQEVDIVSHTVQLGESVRMLSKKYLVDPSEIYRLNKFAVDGIRQGMVLQIPVPRKEPVIEQEEAVAETPPEAPEPVQPQEPIAIQTQNAKPQKTKPVKEQSVTVIDRESETEHTVESGETLYSLSRKYGISVDEIKMSNGGLKKGLQVGQVVKIPSTRTLDDSESSIGSTVTPKSTTISEPQPIEPVTANGETITHQVEPKETLYSLSKKYNVTVDEIKNQNPDLSRHGLQVGQTITITKN